jgi:hypothetical protein
MHGSEILFEWLWLMGLNLKIARLQLKKVNHQWRTSYADSATKIVMVDQLYIYIYIYLFSVYICNDRGRGGGDRGGPWSPPK